MGSEWAHALGLEDSFLWGGESCEGEPDLGTLNQRVQKGAFLPGSNVACWFKGV